MSHAPSSLDFPLHILPPVTTSRNDVPLVLYGRYVRRWLASSGQLSLNTETSVRCPTERVVLLLLLPSPPKVPATC
jgi:hypothetical protein